MYFSLFSRLFKAAPKLFFNYEEKKNSAEPGKNFLIPPHGDKTNQEMEGMKFPGNQKLFFYSRNNPAD